MPGPTPIDDYLADFDGEVLSRLEEIRRRAHAIIPGGTEAVAYGSPTINVDGKHVVYFAGFKKHVSIFPVTEPPADLEARIAHRRGGRGTVKFLLKEPMDYELVDAIISWLYERLTRPA